MGKTHGMRSTKIYRKWASMKTRCTNPQEPCFQYYGGRGITLCETWMSFDTFYADMGDCPEGMELDRIDNQLGYSKDNCRWVPRNVNANNKRNNHPLTYNGQTKNLGQWAHERGIGYSTILHRLNSKWTISQALGFEQRPARSGRSRILLINGQCKTFKELASEAGVGINAIKQRLYALKWPLADLNKRGIRA